MWVPAEAESLMKPQLVCAHLDRAGHSGADATMARLNRLCVWDGMAGDAWDMTWLCVCCADNKAGEIVPRAVEDTRHGREPNAVGHFDFSWERAWWM